MKLTFSNKLWYYVFMSEIVGFSFICRPDGYYTRLNS